MLLARSTPQCVDEVVQAALQDALERVDRQADPVVGHAVLREVVGANLLRAVARPHLPTGTVVICQDERSQLKNRTKAMSVLRARLMAMEQEKKDREVAETRRTQVGSGERSEKSRTYNFPQNRVTDHRGDLSFHNLSEILNGYLDPLIDAVATSEEARLLEAQFV